MADALKATLRTVSLEVKYTKGLVYFDRCGSTADELQSVLGAPFKANVPLMDAAEVKNVPERLTVRFGPASFSVQHDFTQTAIRIVDVAGTAWKVVSERLGMGRNVSRVGVRFFYFWPISSPQEAIVRSPFIRLDRWREGLGRPLDASFTVVSSLDAERKARISVAAVRSDTDETDLSERVLRFLPKLALQIDADVYSETITSLGPGQLREFARSASDWAKSTVNALGTEILKEHA